MKKINTPVLATLVLILITATSCESVGDLVGGIFKAGMWTAVILIVLIVAVVMWLVRKVRRRR